MSLPLQSADALFISRAIDGDLTVEERATFDGRYSEDEGFRQEVDARRRVKDLLGRLPGVPSDPTFAGRVAARLTSIEREERNLLPFPRRYLPVAAMVATVVVAVATFMILQSRIPILRFWEQQAETVRQAYQQSLAQGSLLPLLGNLDSDRALQFAFTGTLQLDEDKGTTLKVDDRSKDGYRIEVQKDAPRPVRGVTVSEFMSAVKPTTAQRRALDSVLNAAREELQTAVLVGANEEVAIKSDLRRLNRAVVSGLAACLEPEQRVKMNRFMTVRDAPYVLMGNDEHPRSSQEIVATLRPKAPRQEFLVLRPDSFIISRLHIDAREVYERAAEHQAMAVELAARRERMIHRWVTELPGPEIPAIAPEALARINVKTRRDRLSIEVNDSLNERVIFFNIGVAPRGWVEEADPALEEMNFEFQVRTEGGTRPGERRVIVAPGSLSRKADSVRAKRRAFPVVVQ